MSDRNIYTTTPPPSGDSLRQALTVAAKIVLVIGVTIFVFFGTCVPLGIRLSEKTNDFVIPAILVSFVTALAAMIAMIHFVFFKKSIVALAIVIILAVVGLIALYNVMR